MKDISLKIWEEWKVAILFFITLCVAIGSSIAIDNYKNAHWKSFSYVRTYPFPAQYENSYVFVTVPVNEALSIQRILESNNYTPITKWSLKKIGWSCEMSGSWRYCKLSDQQGFVASETFNRDSPDVNILKQTIELMSTQRTRNSM
ncbi:MAG: hypothetical protein PHT88_02480 [Candidatus Moranbacteria bacterium]|nr:hypothetical protein [Candidatus Moranbacteria bacterium]